MGRWTIRRSMFGIAGVAGLLGLYRVHEWESRPTCTATPRTYCAGNQRNVVLGLLDYVREEGAFPRGTWPNVDLEPEERLSWQFSLLPHLGEADLAKTIDQTAAWTAPQNVPAAAESIGYLNCPDAPRQIPGGYFSSPFVGIAGLGVDAPVLPSGHRRAGVFGYDRQTSLRDITDGAFCTMVLAESSRSYGSWLTGGHATVRGLNQSDQPYLGIDRQFGGLHPVTNSGGGANIAFADGSVRFISETIDPRTFEALSTIAGGENLPAEAFSPK